MLEGVQILIDRMEHSPQDFIYDPSSRAYGGHTPRFYNIAQGLDSILAEDGGRDPFMHLTAEEKAALLVAYRKMMRQAFTATIIALTFDREERRAPPDGDCPAEGRTRVPDRAIKRRRQAGFVLQRKRLGGNSKPLGRPRAYRRPRR